MAGDSTQFLIDIAARMTGGDAAAATIATLGDRMVSAGASAEQLDATVQRAAAAYDEASAAAKSAADAVTAGTASYAEVQKAATWAAQAYERIALKADEVRAKLARAIEMGDVRGAERAEAQLANLAARQAEAGAKADAARARLEAEAATLDGLKAAAAGAADQQAQMGAAFENIEGAAKRAAAAEAAAAGSGKLNEMAEGFGRLGGPLGRAGQQALGAADGIKKVIASMGAAGVVAAFAVVVVALAAALAAVTIAAFKWAVSMADAARSQALTIEAVSRTSDSLRGLAGILPQVQAATGLATDELVGLAQQLDAAGVSAADMPAALRAVAIAEAALGKGAASKLVEQLKSGKASAAELAAEMERKFGGIVAKKMLSLDAQAARFKQNLSGLASSLNIEALLGGLSTLVALFDTNTASGRALAQLFSTIFQPLIDGAAAAIPAIEGAFIQMEIWAMKAQIALKPYAPILSTIGSGLAMIGKVVGAVLVPVLGVVAAGLALLVAPIYVVIAAIGYLVGLIGGGLSSAWAAVSSGASAAWEALKSAPAAALAYLLSLPGQIASVGADIIAGLVNGITSNAGAILQALIAPIQGGIAAVKSLLGIASPSKVFAQIGEHTAAGFEGGVDAGASDAQTALESMVEPPDPMPAAAAKAGAKASSKASSGSSSSVNLAGAVFNFYGVEGAEDSERRFGDLLTRLVEGDVSQIGGAAPT